MLSLMVHLFGGSVFGLLSRAIDRILPQASLRPVQAVKSDTIRLEAAQPTAAPPAIAKPKPKPPPAPPAARVAPRIVPVPVNPQHELAHITINAPRQNAPSRGQGIAELPQPTPAAPAAPKERYYSESQVAQMNGDFAKAISESHQTLADANAAMQTAPVVTTKRVSMHFNGIHEGLNPGDGVITAIKVERIGDTQDTY